MGSEPRAAPRRSVGNESERTLLPISEGVRSLQVAALTIPIVGQVSHPALRIRVNLTDSVAA